MILIDVPIQDVPLQEFNEQRVENNNKQKGDSHNELCCSKCENKFLV